MAEMRFESAVLGFAIEPTPGTAVVLTAADVKVQVENIKLDIQQANIERNLVRASGGTIKGRPGARLMQATFTMELKGSGTAGVAPGWGDLLRCCRFDEEVVAGNRVIYTPHATNQGPTCTMKLWFLDGFSRTMKGAVGQMKLSGATADIPKVDFTFIGIFHAETEEVPPAYTNYDDIMPPIFVEAQFDLLEAHDVLRTDAVGDNAITLREGAALHTEIAVRLDNIADLESGICLLPLQRLGTPAGFTNGIRIRIEGDQVDSLGIHTPNGVVITNGTSGWVNPLAVPATSDKYLTMFKFPGTVTLGAATTYWIILSGDYTASAVNCVQWVLKDLALADQARTYSGVQFTGVGLDDMTTGGDPPDGAPLVGLNIVIDFAGPNDTFEWFVDGVSKAAGVAITGAAQLLTSGGITYGTIAFGAVTGHTLAESWLFYTLPDGTDEIIDALDAAAWTPFGGSAPLIHLGVATVRELFISKLDFDLAIAASRRANVNATEGWDKGRIGTRKPKVTIDPEMELPSDRNFRQYKHEWTRLMLTWQYGIDSGDIVEILTPWVQVVDEGVLDQREGIMIENLGLQVNTSNTVRDDDMVIVVK